MRAGHWSHQGGVLRVRFLLSCLCLLLLLLLVKLLLVWTLGPGKSHPPCPQKDCMTTSKMNKKNYNEIFYLQSIVYIQGCSLQLLCSTTDTVTVTVFCRKVPKVCVCLFPWVIYHGRGGDTEGCCSSTPVWLMVFG